MASCRLDDKLVVKQLMRSPTKRTVSVASSNSIALYALQIGSAHEPVHTTSSLHCHQMLCTACHNTSTLSPSVTLNRCCYCCCAVTLYERYRIWEQLHSGQSEGTVEDAKAGGWSLLPIIVKANDDLRQEEAVSQMIRQFDRILRDADAGVWLKPYEVCAVIRYIYCERTFAVVCVHCVDVYCHDM
jgi:hypothetical protein